MTEVFTFEIPSVKPHNAYNPDDCLHTFYIICLAAIGSYTNKLLDISKISFFIHPEESQINNLYEKGGDKNSTNNY